MVGRTRNLGHKLFGMAGLLSGLESSMIQCVGYWSERGPEVRFAGLKLRGQTLLGKAAASGAWAHGTFEILNGC